MDELAQAVEAVVGRCLGVAAGERVVVVADSATRAIGEALREAASRAGAEAVLTLMDPRGSDFTLDLTGRSAHSDDGDLTAPRAFGNLPCGEGYIAPLNGRGRLVFASFAGIGLASDRNVVTVEDGRLTAAQGPEAERLKATLEAAGELGTNLAELGVGTNERATLTGIVLEDEKMLGTVHVAFGASMAIGGTVSVPVHLDSVVLEPTLEIGGTRVIESGRFLL